MNFGKYYNSGSLIKKNSGNITYPFFKIAGSSSIENSSISMCITNDGEFVYITGYVTGTHNNNKDFIDFAGVQQTLRGSGQDIFVAKLDKTGEQIYFKTAGCPGIGIDKGCSIGITKSNDFIYISGFLTSDNSNQYFDFTDSLTPKIMKSSHDVFVAKLSSDLDQIFFVTASDAFEDANTIISVSPHDDFVYVAGTLSENANTIIDFGGNTVNTIGNKFANLYVAKIDGTGNQVFFKIAGTYVLPITNSLYSIGSSSSGDFVYVTGALASTGGLLAPVYDDFSGNTVIGKGKAFNVFVAKLDGMGTQIYFKTFGTDTFSISFPQSLKTSCSGDNVYVTGLINFGGSDPLYFDFSDDGILHTLKGNQINAFIAKLDHNGNQIFFNSAGSNGGLSSGLSVDLVPKKTGDIIYVTGQIGGSDGTNNYFDFSDSIIPRTLKGPISGGNIFVARLDGNTGKQIYFKTASAVGVIGSGISISASCSGDYVNVTGYTVTIAGYYDFSDSNILLNPNPNIGLLNIFVAKLTSNGEQIYFKLAGAEIIPDSSVNPSFGNQIITAQNGFVYVAGSITTAYNNYYNFAGNKKYVQEDGGYAFIAAIQNPDYIVGLTTSCTDRCGNTSFITENNVICRKILGLDKNKKYYWDNVEQKITDQTESSCCDNTFIGFTDNGCKFFFTIL